MNNKTNYTILILALIGIGYFAFSNSNVFGSSPGGTRTNVASSTVSAEVGPDINTKLFTAGDCTARAITTSADSAIYLYYATSSSLEATGTISPRFGHIQATGTTEIYDSGLWGCSEVRSSATASTSVTITNFNSWR